VAAAQRERTIEFIVELLLNIVGEAFVQLVFEGIAELGLLSSPSGRPKPHRPSPFLAGFGCLVLGTVAGITTLLLFPDRLWPAAPVPGVSLVVSPLLTGFVMQRYGQWKADHHRKPTFLASFAGGALFAFPMPVLRFIFAT
jgi:hypothetical protein